MTALFADDWLTRAEPARPARSWTISFPAPARMLSTNTVKHWRTTGPVKKAWREAMFVHAKHAKLPQGLRRVRIDIEMRFPVAARRDAPNYHQYLAKPLVDALGPGRAYTIRTGKLAGTRVTEVGYGLIPDDTAQHLDGPHLTIGAPVGRKAGYGAVVVTITDLSGKDT